MDPITILSLTIIYVSIHALLSILVLRDAEKRGIENSVMWASIVVILSGVGLVVYLIRRVMPKDEGEASEDAEFPLPGTERSNESSCTDE